jgi:hypothetical protein
LKPFKHLSEKKARVKAKNTERCRYFCFLGFLIGSVLGGCVEDFMILFGAAVGVEAFRST